MMFYGLKISFKDPVSLLILGVGTTATPSLPSRPAHAANIAHVETKLASSRACRNCLIPTAMTAFAPISMLKMA